MHDAKRGAQFCGVWKANEGAVDGQQPVIMPKAGLGSIIRTVKQRQKDVLVEFREGRTAEFGSGAGECAGGDGGGRGVGIPLAKKLVEMGLEGFEAFLKDKEQDERKDDFAFPGEVPVLSAMAKEEIWMLDAKAQGVDEF